MLEICVTIFSPVVGLALILVFEYFFDIAPMRNIYLSFRYLQRSLLNFPKNDHLLIHYSLVNLCITLVSSWGYPSSVRPRRNELESACPNYLQRDDPFLGTCMVRCPRANTKYKTEAIIEAIIIMKNSWWEAILPDFSLAFATALLIWDETFNISKQHLLAYNVHTSVGREVSGKKQESKCIIFCLLQH